MRGGGGESSLSDTLELCLICVLETAVREGQVLDTSVVLRKISARLLPRGELQVRRLYC